MSATATISRAGPQHMRALQRANEVRLARAELKRGVAAGEIDVAEVILDCPWEAQSMPVADLLLSQRRWGQTRCRKILAQIPISEKKAVGSMTDRQRRTLAAMLSSAERDRAWSARYDGQGAFCSAPALPAPFATITASAARVPADGILRRPRR